MAESLMSGPLGRRSSGVPMSSHSQSTALISPGLTLPSMPGAGGLPQPGAAQRNPGGSSFGTAGNSSQGSAGFASQASANLSQQQGSASQTGQAGAGGVQQGSSTLPPRPTGALPPQTPARHAPGGFPQTPAAQANQAPPPAFNLNPNFQPGQGSSMAPTSGAGLANTSYPSLPVANSSTAVASNQPLVERAAQTIRKTLVAEDLYPAADNAINQGHSADYEISNQVAWSPYQKVRTHEIPDRIFEQFENAQVLTKMGLFADINYAWVTVDNAFYLWDYTIPGEPDVLGFDEQPNSITAVKLVWPKANVFKPEIKRLLVIGTAHDIFLIGVGLERTPQGTTRAVLYSTGMSVSTKGMSVQHIDGSKATGRVFFSGASDNDLYEVTYSSEEKWFSAKCNKINHTRPGLQSMVPQIPFGSQNNFGYTTQILVDDSRHVVYTLSSNSTIRVYHVKANNAALELSITRTRDAIMNDLGHKIGQTALLSRDTSIVSISAISSQEAQRLNLIATTSSGVRIYFSAVYGSIWSGDTTNAPTSMQVYHVKFPPLEANQVSAPSLNGVPQLTSSAPLGELSQTLTPTTASYRYPPGYFLCFVGPNNGTSRTEKLFMAAPDTARIAHPQDQAQRGRPFEFGLWTSLNGRFQDVGLVTPPFAAKSSPEGFGNELATQFDIESAEIAILTNAGIHTFRRRRLVDIFASILRLGGPDGIEDQISNFIRNYGRSELMACAVAVACGQGSDVANDRVVRITDENILKLARNTFVNQGGKPVLNQNFALQQGASLIDHVNPSPRAEGLAMYIARLVRSIWNSKIVVTSNDGQVSPVIPSQKLQANQQELGRLSEFLDRNKTSIEGLGGPEAFARAAERSEEIAMQGEHRALSSLVQLLKDTVEGLAFVVVLLDEPLRDIVNRLDDTAKQSLRDTTFEQLFCSRTGKQLAKALVKAIVDRNIEQGSSVDTITDALRRRCGSFCSADDSVIFKAREQLKKAKDVTAGEESSRVLLNESLRLLETVAQSLSIDQVNFFCNQYKEVSFFGGAIQLALRVASEVDRGNQALAWIHAGSPGADSRANLFATRSQLYEIIHGVIRAVDEASAQEPEMIDGVFTSISKRKREAYEVINASKDELFQTSLYDWYLEQGWNDRLLEVRSPFVVAYLERKSAENIAHADLLWRYHAHYSNFIEAARVQYTLATSPFPLTLEQRIAYLGNAKTNASARTVGMAEVGRKGKSRQELLRLISETLDVASIQSDVLSRISTDQRLDNDRRNQHIAILNGEIQTIDKLYNDYADQASYYDICLLIYEAADYRNEADIRATWNNLITLIHNEASNSDNVQQPWEAIAAEMRLLGLRLNKSEVTFNPRILVPMLERYAIEFQNGVGPPTWVVDIFLNVGIPHETLAYTLESIWHSNEVPFTGRQNSRIAVDLLHVITAWYNASRAQIGQFGASAGRSGLLFGGDENANTVSEILHEIAEASAGGLTGPYRDTARELRVRIDQS